MDEITKFKIEVLKALRERINERKDDESWDEAPSPVTWSSLSNLITDVINDIVLEEECSVQQK